MHFLKSLDYLSDRVHLTFNKEGDIRNKTVYGGTISLISIILMAWATIFFIVNLIKRNERNIISSTESSPYLNLTESYKIPFLFRLSDQNSIPYPNPEKLYKITFKFWYGGSNSTDEQLNEFKQENIDLKVEKCDINKHFGEYKTFFEKMLDLETFYCAIPGESKYNLYGIYGNLYPFSYYNFYFIRCNISEDSNCYTPSEIENTLSNVYMDMRTINYEINSELRDVREITIRSERFMISLSVFKRIWMFLNNIKYITDNGFFLKKKYEINFFQYNSMRYDTDLRDTLRETTVPGTFLAFTVACTGHNLLFIRTFSKVQDYMATLSGIIRIVSIIAQFVNYFYSQNQYYFRLINGFIIPEHQISQRYEENKINSEKEFQIKSNRNNIKLSNIIGRKSAKVFPTSSFCMHIKKKSRRKSMNNYNLKLLINEENNMIIKREIHQRKSLNCLGYILPFFYYAGTQKNKSELRSCFYSINDNLNIVKVLIRLVRSERLLNVYLDNENNKNDKNKSNKIDTLHSIFQKLNKNNIKKTKTFGVKIHTHDKIDENSNNSSTMKLENIFD